MFEFALIYLVPAVTYLLDGIIFVWFIKRFLKGGASNPLLSTVLPVLIWCVVTVSIVIFSGGDTKASLGIQLFIIGLRFFLSYVFFKLPTDRLIFVCVLYSSIWVMVQFLSGELISLIDMSRLLAFFLWRFELSSDAFFTVNKVLLTGEFLLSRLILAVAVCLYLKMVLKAFDTVKRRLTSSELLFLLLPSAAGWFECRIMDIMLNKSSITPSFSQYPYVKALSVVVMLLLFVMSVANILVYKRLYDAMSKRTRQTVLERQNTDIRRHLDEVTGLNMRLRGIRHDLKNHIEILKRLAEKDGGKEELKEYLFSMSEETAMTDSRFSTGLFAIDALLSGKETDAKRRLFEGFSLDADDLIFPKGLLIKEYDIAVILGNALDNAIEACEKEDGRSYIYLSAKKRANMLLMEVKNNFSGKLRTDKNCGFPLTDKADASEHGIGFYNIRMTAEKYHGAVDWSAKDGMFSLTVMLEDTRG